MKLFLILLLAGMHLIKGSDKKRYSSPKKGKISQEKIRSDGKLKEKLLNKDNNEPESWDTSSIARETCSKFIEDQTGTPNSFREEHSKGKISQEKVRSDGKLKEKLLNKDNNESWDTSDIAEVELVKVSQEETCSKFIEDQTGNPDYFREEHSENYMDALSNNLLQICESYLNPKESLNLKQTNKKNMSLTITGRIHNIFENNGSIQVYREVENPNKITWDDPKNLISQDKRSRLEKCLRRPENQKSNCIYDEVSQWGIENRFFRHSDVYRFVMKILFTVLGKVRVERKPLVKRIFKTLRLGEPDVDRKKECQIMILHDALNFAKSHVCGENTAEDVRRIVDILVKEDNLNESFLGYYIWNDLWEHLESTKLLLEEKADMDVKDDEPLTKAVWGYFGNKAEYHRDVFLYGYIPIYIPVANGYTKEGVVKVFTNRFWLKQGADNDKYTPVYTVVKYALVEDDFEFDHMEKVKFLNSSKVKLDESLLSIAKTEELKLLIKNALEKSKVKLDESLSSIRFEEKKRRVPQIGKRNSLFNYQT